MGAKESTITHQNNFNPSQWNQVYQDNDGKVLSNRNNPRHLIEQHEIMISDNKQLQLAEELYQLRLNHPELVSTNYLNVQKHSELCSKSYSGNLYTQHIPIRLSNIVHVPFPDVLHIYNQSLNGFHLLSKRLGNFKVSEDCVGVNQNNVAKVWHSPNFSQISPHHSIDSQHQMVCNIIQMIETNTDPTSMPRQQPSFTQFMYRQNDRVGFGEAKKKLQQYANYFNRGVIPRYLNCVQNSGGAQQIRSQWNRWNQKGGSSMQNLNQQTSSYSNNVGQQQNNFNSVSSYHQNTAHFRRDVPFGQQSQHIPNVVLSKSMVNSGYVNANSRYEPIVSANQSSSQFYRSQTFNPNAHNIPLSQRPVFLSPPVAKSSSNYFASTSKPQASSQIVYNPHPNRNTVYRPQSLIQKPLSANIITRNTFLKQKIITNPIVSASRIQVHDTRKIVAPSSNIINTPVIASQIVKNIPQQQITVNRTELASPIIVKEQVIPSPPLPKIVTQPGPIQSFTVTAPSAPIVPSKPITRSTQILNQRKTINFLEAGNKSQVKFYHASTQRNQNVKNIATKSQPSLATPIIINNVSQSNLQSVQGQKQIKTQTRNQNSQLTKNIFQIGMKQVPNDYNQVALVSPNQVLTVQKSPPQPLAQPQQPQQQQPQQPAFSFDNSMMQNVFQMGMKQVPNDYNQVALVGPNQVVPIQQPTPQQQQPQPQQQTMSFDNSAMKNILQIGTKQVPNDYNQVALVGPNQVVPVQQPQQQQQPAAQPQQPTMNFDNSMMQNVFQMGMKQVPNDYNQVALVGPNQIALVGPNQVVPIQQLQTQPQPQQQQQKSVPALQFEPVQPQPQQTQQQTMNFDNSMMQNIFQMGMKQVPNDYNQVALVGANQVVPVQQPQPQQKLKSQPQQQQHQQQQKSVPALQFEPVQAQQQQTQQQTMNFDNSMMQNIFQMGMKQVPNDYNQIALVGPNQIVSVQPSQGATSISSGQTYQNQINQSPVGIQQKSPSVFKQQPQQIGMVLNWQFNQFYKPDNKVQNQQLGNNQNNNLPSASPSKVINKNEVRSGQSYAGGSSWTGDNIWSYGNTTNFQHPGQVQQYKNIENKANTQKSPYKFESANQVSQPNKKYYQNIGRGIELGQANSATSRYKQSQDYSTSPQKIGRINTFGLDDVNIPTKSPNKAIGQSVGLSNKQKLKQINDSTKDYNQYNSIYGQGQWDSNANAYDTRQNKYQDNYNFQKTINKYNPDDIYDSKPSYNSKIQTNAYQYSYEQKSRKSPNKYMLNQDKNAYDDHSGNVGNKNNILSNGDDSYNTYKTQTNTYQYQSGQAESDGGYRGFFNKYAAGQNYSNGVGESSSQSPSRQFPNRDQNNTYKYQYQQQYTSYNNGKKTQGYRITQTDSSLGGAQKKYTNLLTNKQVQFSDRDNSRSGLTSNLGVVTKPSASGMTFTSGITSNISDLASGVKARTALQSQEDLKYSMVEDDGQYNVNWDPQILADLQANVHRNL